MILTLKEVDHIAALARLELSAEEKEKYRAQLSAILEHIQQLGRVDAAPVDASAQPVADSRLRADETLPSLASAEVLSNARRTHKNQFRVPGIFQEPDA